MLRRVVDITLGNPQFIVELGRELVARGLPEIGEDMPVPGGIEEILGTRVATLEAPVRRLLVAVALSADLRTAELAAIESVPALDAALKSGILLVSGDRVRASHPLLAAAAKNASPPGERRELHVALASAVSDSELRAEHLALAAEGADDKLADTVAVAAAGAAARGARQQAAALSEHALRLTPMDSVDRANRVLAAAGFLEAAGEMRRMTEMLTPELAALPAGAPRGRAWLMLSDGVGPTTMDERGALRGSCARRGGRRARIACRCAGEEGRERCWQHRFTAERGRGVGAGGARGGAWSPTGGRACCAVRRGVGPRDDRPAGR
jgi:hypothetical protein